LTIGTLAIAIASGLSVSAASPVPTEALASAFIVAGSATAHKTQAGRAYLLAEEQCFYDKDEHRWVCIDYRCCCGIC
jgi:hypothetical protein